MDSQPITPRNGQAPVSIEAAQSARTGRRDPSPEGDARTSEPAPGERRDAIDFSTAARRLAQLKAQGGADEERKALLAALRAEVDAGRYRLDPDGIARMMLERGEV